MTTEALLLAALLLGTPLVLTLVQAMRSRRGVRGSGTWGLTARSALAYALAFNLIFFIQELFLVIPKALTPGLKPVLFHNNHDWSGHHPLEKLFQGTGALATVVTALACAAWLRRWPPRAATLRLFAVWLVFCGLMEALPQVVIGAVLPANDVGMAMVFLGFSPAVKLAAALAAIAAIAMAARWIAGQFAALTPGGGPSAMLRLAILPAAAGAAIVLPFRVPGAIDQVVIVPVAVALIGGSWLQAWAWRATPATAPPERPGPLWPLAAALALVLAVFQLVLRPGVRFY